jgi:hypothetical protein
MTVEVAGQQHAIGRGVAEKVFVIDIVPSTEAK